MTDTISQSRVMPWSQERPDGPTELPEELADKNSRILNPLATPDLYYEFYDKAATEVIIKHSDSDVSETYKLVDNINDAESGFHAKIIHNPDTGHYVMLNKGMDMPGRDEGSGKIGFSKDIGDLKGQSLQACISDQVLAAESAYLDLLQDPNVKSLEVVGYSVGSIPANYQASVYGAEVTNIADLGVSGSDEGSMQNFLAHTFNWCGNGFSPGASGEFGKNLEDNVVGLSIRADAMGGFIGSVGNKYGEQIVLDRDGFQITGAAHVPEFYADAARELHDAPETTTVDSASMENNWIPKP